MDLNKISAEVRTRNAWQAIDLGLVMSREWWPGVFFSWFIPACVLYSLFFVLLPVKHEAWAYVLVWWLKPLLDRTPLYIGSRALFAEKLTTRDLLRLLPGICKTDLFPSLLWRRFSLTRSFDLPLTVLEGLKGEVRARRLSLLHQNHSNAATWLTIVCVHLEYVLLFGLMAFVILLIPNEIDIDYLQWLTPDEGIPSYLQGMLYVMCMSLVAPFYVLCGFALYINRRIELEGWDIEIRFRSLAERIRRNSALSVFLVSSLGVMLNSFAPSTAHASDQVLDRETSRQVILEVKNGPDFRNITTETLWRWKNKEESGESIPDWLIDFIEWLEQWIDFEGEPDASSPWDMSWLEVFLWVVAATFIGYLLWNYRKALARLLNTDISGQKAEQETAPDVLFGLDVRKESLPEDVIEEVLRLWKTGQNRDSLGLLYRATLSRLIHEYGMEFEESDTELECAQKVNNARQPALGKFMNEMTRVWQRLAYGHFLPENEVVLQLCDNWRGFFDHEN